MPVPHRRSLQVRPWNIYMFVPWDMCFLVCVQQPVHRSCFAVQNHFIRTNRFTSMKGMHCQDCQDTRNALEICSAFDLRRVGGSPDMINLIIKLAAEIVIFCTYCREYASWISHCVRTSVEWFRRASQQQPDAEAAEARYLDKARGNFVARQPFDCLMLKCMIIDVLIRLTR